MVSVIIRLSLYITRAPIFRRHDLAPFFCNMLTSRRGTRSRQEVQCPVYRDVCQATSECRRGVYCCRPGYQAVPEGQLRVTDIFVTADPSPRSLDLPNLPLRLANPLPAV